MIRVVNNMNNIIEYNGYQAVIEYSVEDATLFGKVMDVDDIILFEIEDPGKAKEVFKDVIEDYIKTKEGVIDI